ncbi:acetolactate synthase 2 small subunit [Alteromonas sp. a30]|uniref:acetolactate synthase 2 small subunit n=1 Tax=Alteromonas sp. a30 TaxID=2730917 RepID=UPI0022829680|nr:acetolactate synthase 2 small subunit [Alteromonas sp. a30]MCY7294947.1 acetolactate synthase 2 small subunit [Alteromonas sp. a30]
MQCLKLEVNNKPAILERVLQVVRYRGFELISLQVSPQGMDMLTVFITVDGVQPISKLTNQLNKLYDLAGIIHLNLAQSENAPHENAMRTA